MKADMKRLGRLGRLFYGVERIMHTKTAHLGRGGTPLGRQFLLCTGRLGRFFPVRNAYNTHCVLYREGSTPLSVPTVPKRAFL
jgi:hypothetical protein